MGASNFKQSFQLVQNFPFFQMSSFDASSFIAELKANPALLQELKTLLFPSAAVVPAVVVEKPKKPRAPRKPKATASETLAVPESTAAPEAVITSAEETAVLEPADVVPEHTVVAEEKPKKARKLKTVAATTEETTAEEKPKKARKPKTKAAATAEPATAEPATTQEEPATTQEKPATTQEKPKKPRALKKKATTTTAEESVAAAEEPKTVEWITFLHLGHPRIRNSKTGNVYEVDDTKRTLEEMVLRDLYHGRWIDGALDEFAEQEM